MENPNFINVEAEVSLLGALFLSGDKNSEYFNLTSPDDFYRPVNATIFSAMKNLWESGTPIDPVTLNTELRAHKGYGVDFSMATILDISEFLPTAANIAHYHALVIKASQTRKMFHLLEEKAKSLYDGIDITSIAADVSDFVYARERAIDEPTRIEELIQQGIDRAYELAESGTGLSGIDTGFDAVNHMTAGWRKGDLIILGARPSMGKSSLALQFACSAADYALDDNSGVALFFSAEMSQEMVSSRLLSIEANVDGTRISNGSISESEKERMKNAFQRLTGLPFEVYSTSPMSTKVIDAVATKVKRARGLSLIVVDFIQMLNANDGERESFDRTREVSKITAQLKSIARRLDVPVIALSSLSRKCEQREDKRPIMSDLRESGDIESHADVVMFIYRPKYYEAKTGMENVYETEDTEIIFAKQRNGPTGVVRVGFTPAFAKFTNLPEDRL